MASKLSKAIWEAAGENYICKNNTFRLSTINKKQWLLRGAIRFAVNSPSKNLCESGGIGRRTGFRFQRLAAWGFESLLSHQTICVGFAALCLTLKYPSISVDAGAFALAQCGVLDMDNEVVIKKPQDC